MSISSKSQARKIDAMSPEQRLVYLTTGRVVVVRFQALDGKPGALSRPSRTYYVARIRGVIVGDEKKWKFETEADALEHGKSYQEYWRKQLATVPQPPAEGEKGCTTTKR